jgi:hypothetical protein
MGAMAEQSGYSQQHGDDCHGQPQLLVTVFARMFRAFFEFFF